MWESACIVSTNTLIELPIILRFPPLMLGGVLSVEIRSYCSILCTTVHRSFHRKVPHLVIHLSPASLRILRHKLPEHKITVGEIIPNISCCCCVYYIDIMPNFCRSVGVSSTVDCCINSECFFPFANAVNFIFTLVCTEKGFPSLWTRSTLPSFLLSDLFFGNSLSNSTNSPFCILSLRLGSM